jgi:hypothetical protein
VFGSYAEFDFRNLNTSLCSSDRHSLALFASRSTPRQTKRLCLNMPNETSNYKYQNFSLGVWYSQSSEISSGSLHHCSSFIVVFFVHPRFGFMSSYICLNPHCKGRHCRFVSKKMGYINRNPLCVGISSAPVCLQVIHQVLSSTTACLRPAQYAAWWRTPTPSI